MEVRRRRVRAQSPSKADAGSEERSAFFVRLGTFKEAVLHRGEHAPAFVYQHIMSGYRLHNLTVRQSLCSLFQWHNETMNVWTHIAGFLLFVGLLVYTAAHASAHVSVPGALRECVQAEERVSCLRTLALSTMSQDQVVRMSSDVARHTSIPQSALDRLLQTGAAHAVGSIPRQASGATRAAMARILTVARPLSNVTLPSWLHRQPHPPAKPLEAPPSPPGRLAALIARARRAPGGLANVTATSLLASAASAAVLGEKLLERTVERTVDLSLVQLSALVASLPAAPELASLQREANSLLASLSDALPIMAGSPGAGPPTLERWPIYFFIATAMVCLMGSAVYHLFGTANAAWTGMLGTLDFIGITALIVGSFVPVLYYGFYERPVVRGTYIGVMIALGSVLLGLCLTPMFHDERFRAVRTFLFTGLGLCGVVPITHMLIFYQWDGLSQLVVWGTAITGGAYLLGTGFYLTRFPEVLAPGKFDLVLSSHNIWHVCVVVAACAHYAFVLQLWAEKAHIVGSLALNASSADGDW